MHLSTNEEKLTECISMHGRFFYVFLIKMRNVFNPVFFLHAQKYNFYLKYDQGSHPSKKYKMISFRNDILPLIPPP